MTDYRQMYLVLCAATDEAIFQLQEIPLALPAVQRLKSALLKAEISTSALFLHRKPMPIRKRERADTEVGPYGVSCRPSVGADLCVRPLLTEKPPDTLRTYRSAVSGGSLV